MARIHTDRKRRIVGLMLVQLAGQTVHMVHVPHQIGGDAGRRSGGIVMRLRVLHELLVFALVLQMVPLVAHDRERLLYDVRLDAERTGGHRVGDFPAGVRRLFAFVTLRGISVS